jgi:hypothetical protein
MVVPGKAVAEAVELARESGTPVRRKPEEIYDNSFMSNLEKSGFLKEIWGVKTIDGKRRLPVNFTFPAPS